MPRKSNASTTTTTRQRRSQANAQAQGRASRARVRAANNPKPTYTPSVNTQKFQGTQGLGKLAAANKKKKNK